MTDHGPALSHFEAPELVDFGHLLVAWPNLDEEGGDRLKAHYAAIYNCRGRNRRQRSLELDRVIEAIGAVLNAEDTERRDVEVGVLELRLQELAEAQ